MSRPVEEKLALAVIEGSVVSQLPDDLYIPPDALKVILESFEGPLDFLLYLIRRQNLDIIGINVADITRQYMAYIELMEAMRFELAAEYLLMAATLAEIKSRALLPTGPNDDDPDSQDPRAELIRRLLEYEKVKASAMLLDTLPRIDRDFFVAMGEPPVKSVPSSPTLVEMEELVLAFSQLLDRVKLSSAHQISWDSLSTRERMSDILLSLKDKNELKLTELFSHNEGRAGIVVALLAILELVREGLCVVIQAEPGSQIYVRREPHA